VLLEAERPTRSAQVGQVFQDPAGVRGFEVRRILKQGCGSGSGLDPDSETLWIRIRIGNPDPDPGARKLRNFIGKIALFSY
jgi:hypothetical protein